MPLINDYGKLIGFISILMGATVLTAMGKMDTHDCQIIYMGVFSYMAGNGRLRTKNEPPSPVLKTTPDTIKEIPLPDGTVATDKKGQ